MKLTHGLAAAVALTFSAMTAQAEITGTVTAVSDYDFRGISLSAKDPALQGSVDYANESGFYVGAWASNIDYGDGVDGDLEIDLYTGIAGETEGGFAWDVGLVYYTYPGADDISDYPEIYASLGYKWFEVKQWYSNDLSGSDQDGFYTEANGTFELPANFGLTLHVGYNYGDAFDAPQNLVDNPDQLKDWEYMDYSVGVTYTLGNFDLGLKYVDTDLDEKEYGFSGDDVFNSEGRAVFSVSTTFPWAKEE
jgi:uncharacterized protein (TIGR02001 family)